MAKDFFGLPRSLKLKYSQALVFYMSDPIKHECGIALIRLLKPLKYYQQKYETSLYGFNKLFLLMERIISLDTSA